MKFIILDIETANYEPTSICQLGIVIMENFEIKQKLEYLVQPYPLTFVPQFSEMHGITAETVADAPTFDVVWESVKGLFDDFTLCLAHNASFDFGHIKATLQYYGYETDNLNFPISCTMKYSQNSEIYFEGFKLEYLCNYFKIKNDKAHTALSDAIATAELLLNLVEANNDNLAEMIYRSYLCSFKECATYKKPKIKGFSSVKQKDIDATNDKFDESHILFGKTIVITGELQSMSRADAYLAIKNVGGLCGDNVTKKTNYLVTNSDEMTGKMKKALQYKEKGQDIEIINEMELYDLLK